MGGALLRAEHLSKRFGEIQALREVSFEAAAGEVHVLAGENGAGKTTLVNILSGLYRADAGAMFVDGRRVDIHSPADAVALGIGVVHQHAELVPPFTALENIVLGHEGRAVWLRPGHASEPVGALARRYGLAVPLDVPVRALSVGEQQKVEILKTLYRGVKILILDEPTTLLTPQEVETLIATVRSLAREGLAVIFITHKIREVRSLGDRVTVLRGGRVAGTVTRDALSDATLVELMFGERRDDPGRTRPGSAGEKAGPEAAGKAPVPGARALAVHDLTVQGDQGSAAVRDGSFEIRTGEIVGLAGVAGNGQRELAEALIGARAAASGVIELFGRDVTHLPIAARIAAGLAYIPGDRLREGILPSLSLAETLALGLEQGYFRHRRAYDPKAAMSLAARVIEEYRIAARDGTVPTAALSGGNFQKVLVARALLQVTSADRAVLVAVNPTRGLDFATTAFVHGRLLELPRSGRAVFLISEDLDELTALCDRILIMHRGRLVGEDHRGRYDLYRMGALMAGAGADAGHTEADAGHMGAGPGHAGAGR